MFWIGLIVGIIAVIALGALFVWACFMLANVNLEDYKGLVSLNRAVLDHRTCNVEVWTELQTAIPVYTDTFKEH